MIARATKSRPAEREPELIGDASVVEKFLALPKKKVPFPGDALANHIHLLMQLHPKLAAQFPAVHLPSMNEPAKELLLKKINTALGITPTKPRRKSSRMPAARLAVKPAKKRATLRA